MFQKKKMFRKVLCTLHPVAPAVASCVTSAFSKPGNWYNPQSHSDFSITPAHACACVCMCTQFCHMQISVTTTTIKLKHFYHRRLPQAIYNYIHLSSPSLRPGTTAMFSISIISFKECQITGIKVGNFLRLALFHNA